ncbi:MAG: methyl-accepting chemotaxis protein [Betaproteobacteria bacterium]|nr:methyl-accepting chemotaxis protein [Betaproteobacteria bacterium]
MQFAVQRKRRASGHQQHRQPRAHQVVHAHGGVGGARIHMHQHALPATGDRRITAGHVDGHVFVRAQDHAWRRPAFGFGAREFVDQRHMVGTEVAEQVFDAGFMQAVDEVACGGVVAGHGWHAYINRGRMAAAPCIKKLPASAAPQGAPGLADTDVEVRRCLRDGGHLQCVRAELEGKDMSFLSSMKVSSRIALSFAVPMVVGTLIVAYSIVAMRTLEHEVNEVAKDRLAKVEALQEVRDGMALAATLASNAVITPEASARESEKRRILTLRAETQQKLAALDKKFVIPRSRELLQQIASTRASYNEMIDRVLELAERGDSVAAGRLLLGSVRERQEVLFRALDESIALQREQANGLASKAASDAAFGAGLLVVLALVMISLAAGLAWGIVRNLTRAFGAEPEEVNAAVNRVARGELTQQIALRPGDTHSIMAGVKRMQESLAVTVARVRGNADSVATAAMQISQGNMDLSHRTEEQASALQQTAASMEELSGTVRQNSTNSQRANQLALEASEVAQRGGNVVAQVVDKMSGIHESSRKIGEIIVEAARAGEQGRGFAVVASEVRNLAQRSAAAAREIKALITSSVDQVGQGSTLVAQAGETMQEIVSAIQRVSDIVGEISAASVEQSSGVAQIGQAVSQMDQTTQQNAALVEQSAAAADSLRKQADELVVAVAAFQIGREHGGAPARELRSEPRVAPVPAPVAIAAPVRAAAPQPAAAPTLQSPLRPSAKVQHDEWESF